MRILILASFILPLKRRAVPSSLRRQMRANMLVGPLATDAQSIRLLARRRCDVGHFRPSLSRLARKPHSCRDRHFHFFAVATPPEAAKPKTAVGGHSLPLLSRRRPRPYIRKPLPLLGERGNRSESRDNNAVDNRSLSRTHFSALKACTKLRELTH